MNIGVLRPLCDLLTVQDPRVVLITLEGMECILKAGIGKRSINGGNLYALLVEEADGTHTHTHTHTQCIVRKGV